MCRAWFYRARRNLYRNVIISLNWIPKLEYAVRNNPDCLLSFIKRMTIVPEKNHSVSMLLTRRRFPNLTHLELAGLDFTREHSLFSKSLPTCPVHTLELHNMSFSASQLIRLVNNFQSLTSLTIVTGEDHSMNHNGQILPRPRHIRLTFLYLSIVPRMNIFIEQYLLEGNILAELKTLRLSWKIPYNMLMSPHTYFVGVKSLLNGCGRP